MSPTIRMAVCPPSRGSRRAGRAFLLFPDGAAANLPRYFWLRSGRLFALPRFRRQSLGTCQTTPSRGEYIPRARTSMSRTVRAFLQAFAALLIVGAVAFFFRAQFVKNWNQVRNVHFQIDYFLLLLALVCILAAYL